MNRVHVLDLPRVEKPRVFLVQKMFLPRVKEPRIFTTCFSFFQQIVKKNELKKLRIFEVSGANVPMTLQTAEAILNLNKIREFRLESDQI